jgi:hypothetical protein
VFVKSSSSSLGSVLEGEATEDGKGKGEREVGRAGPLRALAVNLGRLT